MGVSKKKILLGMKLTVAFDIAKCFVVSAGHLHVLVQIVVTTEHLHGDK